MHTFKNFKNFEYAEIDLSKPMTLLIGRNGSGKSNVIEGVELLAELIKGREVHEISDIGRGGRFEIRGNLIGCFKQGEGKFEIGFEDKISYKEKEEKVFYNFIVNLKPEIKIDINKSDAFFMFGTESGADDNVKEKIQNSLNYMNEVIKKNTLSGHFITAYKTISVFDIYPRFMRQYSPTGLKELSRNGENISSVLYYLKQNKPDVLENILKNIRQLPEEAFESFEFITTSDNSDVLFALKYPNGEIISAKLLSDGTLRALAILTALETVPEGSRIIIEEIDNGVHASRVHVLIDAIWEASNRRHLNTLITTHNPATLDSLNDEQLECVVVCHYDKQSQSAKLTPFFELPRVYELLEHGHLGSLVVRNVIEKYLDPKFEEQQQQVMDEWLESLA
jgi:predicted ATPase